MGSPKSAAAQVITETSPVETTVGSAVRDVIARLFTRTVAELDTHTPRQSVTLQVITIVPVEAGAAHCAWPPVPVMVTLPGVQA